MIREAEHSESKNDFKNKMAIAQKEINLHQNNKVSFYYKDYKTAGIIKQMTLDTDEFIRRFLQHVY